MFRVDGLLQIKTVGDTTCCKAVLILGEEISSITAAGWDFIFQHSEFVFCRTTPEQVCIVQSVCLL